MTAPFIYGWTPHSYLNVPAELNVFEYWAPFFRMGDSESSNFTVWLAGPGWVQVTVSPFLIVMDVGWNLKSLINTCSVAAEAMPVRKTITIAIMINVPNFMIPPKYDTAVN